MAKVKAKKKSKMDLIKEQRARLKAASGGGKIIYLKADETLRLRNVPTGEDETPGIEVIHYYLGSELKGIISPASLGLPCAIEEYHSKLSDSGDPDDKEIAAELRRRTKVVMPVYKFQDEKGKKPDIAAGVRLLFISPRLYEDWLAFYLDEEKGDPSDPKEGYDIKWIREGSGMTDTTYKIMDCKPTRAAKEFSKIVNAEELLRAELASYEETADLLKKWQGGSDEDDDEDDLPKPKKKKKVSSKKKKVKKK